MSKMQFVFLSTLLLASCSICGEEIKSEVRSPDARYVINVLERNCGATTPFVTHVNIREQSMSFRSDSSGAIYDGEIFTIKGQHKISVSWLDPGNVEIRCASCRLEDISFKNESWRNIQISYKFPFASQASNKQRARFQWMGEALLGSTSDHSYGLIRGFSHMYTASDGATLFHTGLNYHSEAQANRELKRKLRDALRIIEKESNVDEHGKKVGVRTVAVFPYYSSDKNFDIHKTTISVLKTNKNQVTYIESSSLEDALEFERSLRNH